MHNANDLPITISLPQGFTIGGVTTWALAIARRFATPSRQVRLIAHPPLEGHATFDPAPSLADANVRIVHAPALSFQADFDSCVAIYAAQLPTLLLPNLCAESFAIAAQLSESRANDLRVIAWIHGDNPVDYAYLEHYEPIVHRYVAVSRQCQAEFTSRRPHRKQDIAYIPHALPLPRPIARSPLKNRPLRILYAGRMELGVKRVVDILAIARRLCHLDIPFDLRLIGDGPHADMIDARIASLTQELNGRRGAIRREAARGPHEMDAAWQWADVAILTSRLEGFSVSTLEAMAAGCVPVVTNVASGVSDIIRHGRNGMTFPIGAIEAGADCLARLAASPDALAAMSGAARDTIASDFGVDRHDHDVASLFAGAVADADRQWPSAVSIAIQSIEAPTGAVPQDAPSPTYDRIAAFLCDQPDRRRIVVYGLGVNGQTLVERIRADRRFHDRALLGLDDHASDDLLATLELPRATIDGLTPWPDDAIAVITPNVPDRMCERLESIGACRNTDFTALATTNVIESPQAPGRMESLSC